MSLLSGFTSIGSRAAEPVKPAAEPAKPPANYPAGLSDAELADAYGDVDARYQDLADERRSLKLEIVKRRLEVVVGAVYIVEVKVSKKAGFDRDALRAKLGELTPYMTVSESTSLTARPIKRAR